MTTNHYNSVHPDGANVVRLEENLSKVEELTQRFLNVMARKRQVPQPLQGPSHDLYLKAATAYWTEMMQHPAKLIEQQVGYWGKTLQHYVAAQQMLAQGKIAAPPDPTPKDRRFSNPLWETHPYFNFIKQQYLFNAEAIEKAVAATEGLDERERKRLEYFSRQIIDMFSPTNFLATNPDALEKAVATEGQSLVDGLENLVADLERNDGEVIVTLADRDAFKVGENLATTPGAVVFRNAMFELIQYKPTTGTVHETPLIIFPPWINKFYILDLKPANSLIKWVVDQGFTLFVVSWVNPDPTYRDKTLADYIENGFLRAMTEVKAICGVKKVNAVGYCIAGTTLSLTLAVMKKRKDTSVNAATLFTTLTDFSDPGEVGVFLDNDFVDAIEAEAGRAGVLESFYMERTFTFLRSNDLIYQPAIRNYMLGEAPPAFDLLYWNGDGTNLPAAMAVEYLRHLCQNDEFAQGGFAVAGEVVRLEDVTVPICAIACETDHIAAWRSSYRGVCKMGSNDKTFILSESGHIAGIVNPPTKRKYGHYTNPDIGLEAADWLASSDKHEGTWWLRWGRWLAARSDGQVPARQPGDSTHPVLCAAPGTHVTAVPKRGSDA
jgi:polyhydroxyalkanoate synthase subunit PhaC